MSKDQPFEITQELRHLAEENVERACQLGFEAAFGEPQLLSRKFDVLDQDLRVRVTSLSSAAKA